MCESAPGPRCSSHAREELTRTREAYREATERLNAATDALRTSKHAYSSKEYCTLDATVERTSREHRKAQFNYADAKTTFNSTPAGQERLYEKMSHAVNVEDYQTVAEFQKEILSGQLLRERQKIAQAKQEGRKYTPTKRAVVADARLPIRVSAARSRETKSQMLVVLSADTSPCVREHVAGNINTPRNVLESLAHDSDLKVVLAVVKNPSTPSTTVDRLALHAQPDIRQAVVERKETKSGTVRHLSRDEVEAIRELASSRL